MNELEGYFGDTQSRIFQLAAGVLAGDADPPTADCAGHAGVAYGLALRLAGLAADRRAGRTIIPADLMARHGLDAGALYGDTPPAVFAPVVTDLVAAAHSHLDRARANWVKLPASLRRDVLPAFLPLAVVAPLLRRIAAEAAGLAVRPVVPGRLMILRAVTAAALRRRPA